MNDSLSIAVLITEAGLVVQGVMGILVLLSVVSWGMIAQRTGFFSRRASVFKRFEDEFWSGEDLTKLYNRGSEELNDGRSIDGAEAIFRSGYREFARLRKQTGIQPEAIMQGVNRSMRIALSREQEKLDAFLSFLATVGSTSPYVGLFGTVWGIMNSFRGLANVQQATLAVVAPGISEALIATAMGLFAAIPAVIAYNRFSSASDKMAGSYETFADEFAEILHRQVHATDKARGK